MSSSSQSDTPLLADSDDVENKPVIKSPAEIKPTPQKSAAEETSTVAQAFWLLVWMAKYVRYDNIIINVSSCVVVHKRSCGSVAVR